MDQMGNEDISVFENLLYSFELFKISSLAVQKA